MNIPNVVPGRKIEGISAVLLPFNAEGKIDLEIYTGLVERTWVSGLIPAVNMDTGYVNLLTENQQSDILRLVSRLAKGRRFVAGAFIEGRAGDPSQLYQQTCQTISEAGGTPILFPCSSLAEVSGEDLVRVFKEVAATCPEFLGFELSRQFVPFGRIWELDTYKAMLDIPQLKGAKHSSLSRELEWDRLAMRDTRRPDFKVYTGNDLAIDLVQWGSDYLLGLSAFHVEAFANRDRLWAKQDAGFFEINDWLQYLGMFAFRAPVPAYKHTCAQFLKLRGLIPCDHPHPKAARRPDTDVAVLALIAEKLDALSR
jgi:dihydrodipicolinate synthase/N-acetylneuraminate lyase